MVKLDRGAKRQGGLGMLKPMVALCGNARGKEDSLLAFPRLKEVWPRLKVAVSGGAERLFQGSRRPFAGYTVALSDPDFMDQVQACDGVILLNPSMNLIAKMSALISDCPPSMAAFSMLERSLPVYLVSRPLERTLELPGIGPALSAKLSTVEGFGVRRVSSWEALLSGGLAAAGGPSAPRRAPALPAPRRAPALTATSTGGGGLRPPSPGDCLNCPVQDGCAKYCPELVEPVRKVGAVRISSGPGHLAGPEVAALIDHTLLKAETTEEQIRELCAEAAQHSFASVCVNPNFVRLAARELAGTRVKVCTVVGFPLGATSTEAKVCETRQAVLDGADEIDMVINIGALKNHEDGLVEEDIRQVVRAAEGRVTKVILETALLDEEQKVRGCILTKRAGAHFVKTSTGFSTGGATLEDVALMRKTVGPDMGVKASGGVRDLDGARAMVAAGATRIGASASVAIVSGGRSSGGY